MEPLTIIALVVSGVLSSYFGWLKAQRHLKCRSACIELETDASTPSPSPKIKNYAVGSNGEKQKSEVQETRGEATASTIARALSWGK